MSFLQTVSNWLSGDYKVLTFQLADKSLIQGVTLLDQTGAPASVTASFSQIVASAVHTESVVSVTNASAVILAAYASRKGGWIKNIDIQACFVSLSGTATTAKPTKLQPGEVLELSQGGIVYQGAVAGITSSSTCNVEVVDF